MNDTISRQEAIDALDCINGVEEVLKSLPSTGPERKTGKWIHNRDEDGWHIWLECSECGTREDNTNAKFCQECGSYNGG